MKLKKLKITDTNPLVIDFDSNTKFVDVADSFTKRNEKNTGIISVIEIIEIFDNIKEILDFFFAICDKHYSPQKLWTINKVTYSSLILDYKKENQTQFDEIIDKLINLSNSNIKVDKDYIVAISVSYPETWEVEYRTEY
jgi:hypothetical protein